MSEQPMKRLLAVRHVNGIAAKTPWNNEQLVRLREPLQYTRTLSYNTSEARKALRDDGGLLETPPYLICTTWEGIPWTHVHGTPDSFLTDGIIDRADNAIVVHAWADIKADKTFLRMHKKGQLVGDVVFRGVREADPLYIEHRESKVFRPGYLKYCKTTGEALDQLVDQVGIDRKRGPALVADGSRFRLTCDPSDIKSVRVVAYATPTPFPAPAFETSARDAG
jgi:hypothetical protein